MIRITLPITAGAKFCDENKQCRYVYRGESNKAWCVLFRKQLSYGKNLDRLPECKSAGTTVCLARDGFGLMEIGKSQLEDK